METALLSILATLLGVLLGYRLHSAFQEKLTRRLILREIAFEYRRLASTRESGGVSGLIRAGILQCVTERETRQVLSLVDDLAPVIEAGSEWRPKSGRILEFLRTLRKEGIDPTDIQAVNEIRRRIDGEERTTPSTRTQ
ncbi:hypothetical protein [Kiritimatiella glycovorans]|uniref:hypothetical protein n=1 Tax=Kiritimatiella glycovorans TaxID=1307763 RepID=UPI00069B4DE9|nr:hypothetical protein [Kiritimatiella glycovorans]